MSCSSGTAWLALMIAGFWFLRSLAFPWFRTHVIGYFVPPTIPGPWLSAARRFGVELLQYKSGVHWVLSGWLPIAGDRSVPLSALTTRRSALPRMLFVAIVRHGFRVEPVDTHTAITIDARELIPASVVLRARPRRQLEAAKIKYETIGRPPNELELFHAAVEMRAERAWTAAVLDQETRLLLRTSVLLGFTVQDGCVRFEAENLDADHIYIETTLERLSAVVRCLALAEDEVLPRLEKVALEDPSEDVRAEAVAAAMVAYPHARILELLERARSDPSPVVRVQVLSGVDAVQIEEVAAALAHPHATFEVMKKAVKLMVRRFRRDEVEACLVRLFEQHRTQECPLRIALIESLGRLKAASAAPALAELFRDPHAATRESAARAIGWIGEPRFEAELSTLLGDRDDPVVEAAVWALGACGTVASIAPLRALGDGNEVVEAVQRIIARCGVPRQGMLALVGGEGDERGALSLGAQGGELALSEGERPEG